MTEAERFESIYREYKPKVSSYIRSRVGNPEDAEDLCSEVFRKALEHLDQGIEKGISSFLYTITRNSVIDYYRTRRETAQIPEDLPAQDSPEDNVLSSDTLERLAVFLRQLPERERDIIVLHYYADNSLKDIAARMELPYGVIKRAHQSALKKLRGFLQDT